LAEASVAVAKINIDATATMRFIMACYEAVRRVESLIEEFLSGYPGKTLADRDDLR